MMNAIATTQREPRLVISSERLGNALAAAMLAATATAAAWMVPATAAAETELRTSRVSVAGTGVFLNGDDDQFRQRHGIPPDFTGGVEDLYMEWGLGEGTTMKLDGRGMFDRNDYRARLRIENPDKGYVTAGYREFRTWYDGTGGFFPQNGLLISYFDEDLRLDRGEAWLEAGLRVPNVPEVTARYAHLFRDGQKGSTAWGDTQLTGGFGTRNVVPALWSIDETRDVFELDVGHEIRGTDVGAGVMYEDAEISNARHMRRRPGEPQDRFLTQDEDTSTDVWDAHAFTSTPFFGERAVLSTSYAYTDVDSDIGGSRIYGTEFDAAFDPALATRQPFDEGFLDLDGSTELHQHVATLTLQGRLSENFHVTGGLRGEREDARGDSSFAETTVGNPPGLAVTLEDLAASSETNDTRTTESLEARYTGVENWVLWLAGEWEQDDGDLFEREIDAVTGDEELVRNTDMDIARQKYTAGATWYPAKRVNLAGRYTYRFAKYDFDHDVDSTPGAGTDRFPAFITAQNIFTHSGDLRLTYRVLSNLRTTARYDVAFSEYEQESEGLSEVESADVRTHRIGGNVSWNPTAASWVQGDANYVMSTTDTPANNLTAPADDLAVDFDNDYWTASLVSGIALDEKTDVQGRYFYFRAKNYDDNSAVSQPYGLDAEEHGFSVALGRQLTEAMRATLVYGFFTNDEELAGGANDYDASAITGALEVTF